MTDFSVPVDEAEFLLECALKDVAEVFSEARQHGCDDVVVYVLGKDGDYEVAWQPRLEALENNPEFAHEAQLDTPAAERMSEGPGLGIAFWTVVVPESGDAAAWPVTYYPLVAEGTA